MTNYEAMRTMDKDELTEFLSSIMDGEAIRITDKDELAEFLSRIMDGKKCPASEKFCDGQRDCVDAILNWLNAESDDDTVVEHPEGQTINISHSMESHGGVYCCCAYTRGESTRLYELKECPRKWEPPEYIKRMSVERNNLLDKIKKLEDFLEDHEGIVIDTADSYLMHQQIAIMQKYVDILTTRIVHDTTKEKAKRNE